MDWFTLFILVMLLIFTLIPLADVDVAEDGD